MLVSTPVSLHHLFLLYSRNTISASIMLPGSANTSMQASFHFLFPSANVVVSFLMSAALDGGTSVMIFVYTFAVGGGSGTVRPMPNWALVSYSRFQSLLMPLANAPAPRIQQATLTTACALIECKFRPARFSSGIPCYGYVYMCYIAL